MLVRVNILEAYDILYDFINHKHDQKGHAKKVIQQLFRNSEVYFTAGVQVHSKIYTLRVGHNLNPP